MTITTSWADKKKNILSLKESITDNDIQYPASFDANNDMMKQWYNQFNDAKAINQDNDRNYGTVSDSEYKKRLQNLSTTIEMPFNQIVKSYIERYVVKGRTLVAQLVGMCPYYMPIFEDALERHHMPLELKYIPIIESALNPNAVSPAGAGGLWQFMPSTAKGIGMEVNSSVDQRRDPYESSEKAAVFFQKLYGTYGDWSLAIAAYNCGPGNVNKAIKRTGNANADFWEIYNYLPRETRGYVPAFIAACYVMTYYKNHGITPLVTKDALVIDTVMVNKRVSFRQISNALKIPIEEIRILNPQYRNDVIPGNVHPYTLALPRPMLYSYIKNEKSIISSSGHGNKPDDDMFAGKEIIKHEVREGEDIYDIAEIYGMKVEDIMSLNEILSADTYLRPNRLLKVVDFKAIDGEADGTLAMNSNQGGNGQLQGGYNDYAQQSGSVNGKDYRNVPDRRKVSDQPQSVPERKHKDDDDDDDDNYSYNYNNEYVNSRNENNNGNYGNASYDNDNQDYEEELREYREAKLRQQQEEAEELAAQKKMEQEAAAAERKREQEAAAAAAKKKKQQEAAAAAAKKKKQQEAAAAAKKKREQEAAAKKKREQEAAAAAKKKREQEAAERKRREEAAKPITHEVKEGSNLTKIAKQYGTTPEAIRKANNLKGDEIRAGQKLNIPKNNQRRR